MKLDNPDLNRYRVNTGPYGTDESYGTRGLFLVPFRSNTLTVLSTGTGRVLAEDISVWEHVSVSLKNRCPNWEEMCFVKSLFWGEEETVIQFHPKKSEYRNLHPFCLHLWKKVNSDHELPSSHYVA